MRKPLLLALLALLNSALLTAADRPNVLFLFADDHAYDAINALGGTEVRTPNLDRLARSGAVFTHAYNMGSWSGAVCVASRTMLITGRSVWRANAVYGKKTEGERAAGRLWPQMMSKAGYATAMTGKWHITAEAEKCFDVVKDVRAGMPKDTKAAYGRPTSPDHDEWSPYDTSLGGYWQGGKHWSEVVGDNAVGFLDAAKGSARPFFAYVAFNAPHDPRQSPKEYVDLYPRDKVAIPASFQPEYPHAKAIGAGKGLRDEDLAPFPRTELAVRTHRQEYYAIITHMDAQIGRILDALERNGQAKDTWVIFTADHGLAVGRHGLMGKQNMHDHSLRVPFIIRGPGVTAGDVERQPQVVFRSVLPLLKGDMSGRREAVYGGYLELQRAVIQDGWKLIAYPKAGVFRLYHLAKDPEELKDLANDPALRARRAALFDRLTALQKELDDKLDLSAMTPLL
ncbi:MAG: sulfatase-like hydrolase/transferase [Opitutia bacterium]